jgi:hypothetical protein
MLRGTKSIPSDVDDVYDTGCSEDYQASSLKFGLSSSGVSLIAMMLVLFLDGFAINGLIGKEDFY